MNERVLATNKTSATPPVANQASSPLLHQSSFTSELSESFCSNSNISKELGGIQPKTIRRSLNWKNITVEAPHRSSASSTYSGGIQRLETSGVKEQEESTEESLQMPPLEAIQSKSSSGEPQEKEEQNKESIQTKLTVGAPGDKYEQEADSMAAKVMTMPDSAIQQPIQRQTGEELPEPKPEPEPSGKKPPGKKPPGNRLPRTTELPPEEVSRLVFEHSPRTFRLNRKNVNNLDKIVVSLKQRKLNMQHEKLTQQSGLLTRIMWNGYIWGARLIDS
jgi:hypothetical protein